MISHHFNLLKKLVTDIANLTNFTSSDCKILSTLIYQKTKKRLSETTLKRVYGFAYSKFNSSLFTLDTLSQYCNYPNWATFLAEYENESGSDKTVNWLNLGNEAAKVTKFSTRVLINRSGIPYKKTIKRKFIDDHLTGFLASDCIATVLTAPAGYGKTTALLHWLEEKQDTGSVENDIILFFSTPALMSVLSSGQDIYLWLLSLLGYNRTEISELLLSNDEKATGKFFLIIDGLDEHMFKNDQFQLVLNQIIDILSLYQTSTAFKLIITMRSNTWNNNKYHLGDEKNWFQGFMNQNNFINVPPFNLQEINELCYKINPVAAISIDADVMDILSYPLYFQLYYKLNAPNCSFNNIGRLSKYEIISAFILDKIYLDRYSSEKILLLFELINMMSLKDGAYYVNKLKADELITKYNYVYNELLT